jgi:hypothetical protein
VLGTTTIVSVLAAMSFVTVVLTVTVAVVVARIVGIATVTVGQRSLVVVRISVSVTYTVF